MANKIQFILSSSTFHKADLCWLLWFTSNFFFRFSISEQVINANKYLRVYMGNDALKIKRKRNIFINVCVFINTFIRFSKVPNKKKVFFSRKYNLRLKLSKWQTAFI